MHQPVGTQGQGGGREGHYRLRKEGGAGAIENTSDNRVALCSSENGAMNLGREAKKSGKNRRNKLIGRTPRMHTCAQYL